MLELIIVISIAAVLLGIAAPAMRSFILSNERAEASTSLYSALVTARSEAIARNAYVLVCARDPTAANSSPKCQSSGANWTQGWVVLRDANNNGVLDSGEPAAADVIAAGDATDTAFTLAATPSTPAYVTLSSSGRPAPALQFKLCQSGNNSFQGRIIYLDASGHITLAPYTCP